MILAYHFGDLKEAASFEKAMRKDLYAEGSEPPGLSTRIFYTVLVYLGLYRQTNRAKYKKNAMASKKIMLHNSNVQPRQEPVDTTGIERGQLSADHKQ